MIKNTSFRQKLLLIIFGLFLAVILLEIGLRIAGGIVLLLQERHNHLTFNPNEYRILCLGESTTALGGEDSYPSQLEALLNLQSHPKKFTVINKGVISTTTDDILAHIEQYLDIYKPQLVIVMMGINDKAYLQGANKTLWWEDLKYYLKNFRVYKLFHLLYEHISHRINKTNTIIDADELSHAEEGKNQQLENFLKLVIAQFMDRYHEHMLAYNQYQKDRHLAQALQEEQYAIQSLNQTGLACIELARRYRLKNKHQDAQNILQQAIVLTPNNTSVYQELGELQLAKGDYAQSVKSFQKALLLDPHNTDVLPGLARAYRQEHAPEAFIVYDKYLQIKPQDYWVYIELAQWLREEKHDDIAIDYLKRAIEIGPDFEQGYIDIGQILDDLGQFEKEEAFYLKEISLHPKRYRLYQAIGQLYQKQGKEELSRKYLSKAVGQAIADYYPETFVNYALVLDRILSRNIKVFVMQYPLKDIAPLKDYLGQRNGVTFVENKQNFKLALTKQGFSYYFKDNFAYNFGHCTRAGNELIACNLADIILKKH